MKSHYKNGNDSIFDPPSRDQFAQLIIDSIYARGEKRPVHYDADRFMLIAEGEPMLLLGHVYKIGEKLPQQTTLALTRYYDEYCSLPRQKCQEALEKYVCRWFTLPTEESDPLKRTRMLYSELPEDGKALFRRQFGNDVDEVLGVPSSDDTFKKLTISISGVPLGASVDGDSYILAAALASISKLANVGLDQGIAVTGAMNANGDVLPVKHVNVKIEGWFDTCQHNFTGKQGVIIPKDNEQDLNLRPDIAEAVKRNMFHIYPVKHIDEAIELVTGFPVEYVKSLVKQSESDKNSEIL